MLACLTVVMSTLVTPLRSLQAFSLCLLLMQIYYFTGIYQNQDNLNIVANEAYTVTKLLQHTAQKIKWSQGEQCEY